MCAGVLSFKLALLANVHLLTGQAHVTSALQRVTAADRANNARVLKLWPLLKNLFLLDCNGNLLGDLRLDHLDEELFVLGVHSTRAFAPSARVRSTLLCLPAVASKAGYRLG